MSPEDLLARLEGQGWRCCYPCESPSTGGRIEPGEEVAVCFDGHGVCHARCASVGRAPAHRLPLELRRTLNAAIGSMSATRAPWVLFGSAVLLLHGLRERVGDIDVFMAHDDWEALARLQDWEERRPDASDPPFLACEVGGFDVHVFYDWTRRDPEVSAWQCLRAAERVDGWWCTPLEIVRLHKAMSIRKLEGDPRREKHRADVYAIDAATGWQL